jgi:hypothetical protein
MGVREAKDFITEVCCDGFPPSAAVAFHEREEQLKGAIMPVLSKIRHRGAGTCHVPFVNCPHIGERRVRVCEKRRVLCTHHINSCLCVNLMLMWEVCFLWNEKSLPSEVAQARRAPRV